MKKRRVKNDDYPLHPKPMMTLAQAAPGGTLYRLNGCGSRFVYTKPCTAAHLVSSGPSMAFGR